MAKGAVMKKRSAPSVHSRAARRATSPGIDTDKSLKNVRPPTESLNARPAVLAAHAGAGVTKKKSGRKAELSARARRRQEKGLDRAAAVVERTAVKVQKSKGKSRAVQGRRKAWEEINGSIPKLGGGGAAAGGNKFAGLADEGEDDGFVDTDEEMDEGAEAQDAQRQPAVTGGEPAAQQVDEDEIL
ncbi:hypothetical protein NKR23_g7940 [Pleurostoma richardsiae]|uniref:Alb1-domain-containing protein n=1 Tax=Pleurostoma richardsiae TaxID=41990 RepID=A0AA38R9B5_9PEZI|nr:hypothetical protein NKR23_g7940 [Pleurostoma richardsiae]